MDLFLEKCMTFLDNTRQAETKVMTENLRDVTGQKA